MYGNRKEICNQLNKMFIGDEPLVVLFWTESSIADACERLEPSQSEVVAVMEALGNIHYERYQAEGVNPARFPELLLAHRETMQKKVEVPEVLLRELIRRAGRDVNEQIAQAWQAGKTPSASLTRAEYQITELKNLLGPETGADEDEE
jgi:hypothetical protein